jgi:hypothetical protein
MRKIHLDKFHDRPEVGKASLMFVEENKICDGCDSPNVKCAIIKSIGNHVMIICQDCIEGILESLDPSIIRDIKLNKLLNEND